MKTRIPLIAALAVAVSGCGQAMLDNATRNIPPPVSVYELTDNDLKIVETGVRKSLKDPASAILGSMKAAKRADGMVTVCGYVNGKNSFGGYVGMKPFIGLLTLSPVPYFGVTGMGSDESGTSVVIAFCQKAGIFI